MDKDFIAVIGEQVGEIALGCAIGKATHDYTAAHCDTVLENMMITTGSIIGAWIAGRIWCKHYTDFVNDAFGTNLSMNGAYLRWTKKKKKKEP